MDFDFESMWGVDLSLLFSLIPESSDLSGHLGSIYSEKKTKWSAIFYPLLKETDLPCGPVLIGLK